MMCLYNKLKKSSLSMNVDKTEIIIVSRGEEEDLRGRLTGGKLRT